MSATKSSRMLSSCKHSTEAIGGNVRVTDLGWTKRDAIHNFVLGFDLYHPNAPPSTPPRSKTKIRIGTGILTGLPNKMTQARRIGPTTSGRQSFRGNTPIRYTDSSAPWQISTEGYRNFAHSG
jgi:hypothetical protein